ncbi:hypothetical protein PGT21_017698 [Puccinia graminis f. sp. tritici]|uniref:Uncharacterized protein n=1 Tax=Puccinia graminis f. sp. tritici TaxID=56615 RepID=A0A5B0MFV4_PUCGR|nr:hypothetical protein PGT21_017698 [Puccinia graminis f. sp. tritici]
MVARSQILNQKKSKIKNSTLSRSSFSLIDLLPRSVLINLLPHSVFSPIDLLFSLLVLISMILFPFNFQGTRSLLPHSVFSSLFRSLDLSFSIKEKTASSLGLPSA